MQGLEPVFLRDLGRVHGEDHADSESDGGSSSRPAASCLAEVAEVKQ